MSSVYTLPRLLLFFKAVRGEVWCLLLRLLLAFFSEEEFSSLSSAFSLGVCVCAVVFLSTPESEESFFLQPS